MQYTTENTEGYSSEDPSKDLVKLNRIYEQQIALLNEDERGALTCSSTSASRLYEYEYE